MAIIIRRFLLEESRPKFVTTDPQSVLFDFHASRF